MHYQLQDELIPKMTSKNIDKLVFIWNKNKKFAYHFNEPGLCEPIDGYKELKVRI